MIMFGRRRYKVHLNPTNSFFVGNKVDGQFIPKFRQSEARKGCNYIIIQKYKSLPSPYLLRSLILKLEDTLGLSSNHFFLSLHTYILL